MREVRRSHEVPAVSGGAPLVVLNLDDVLDFPVLALDRNTKSSHISEDHDAIILKADRKAPLVLRLQDLFDLEVRP